MLALNPILLLQLGFALLFLLSLLLRLVFLELLLLAQLLATFLLLVILLRLCLSFHFSLLLRLPPFQLFQSLLLSRWLFLRAEFLTALILPALFQLRFALFFVSLVLFLTIQFLLLSLPFPLRCLFFLSLAVAFLLCRWRSYSIGDSLVRLRWRRLLWCIKPFGALEGFMGRQLFAARGGHGLWNGTGGNSRIARREIAAAYFFRGRANPQAMRACSMIV